MHDTNAQGKRLPERKTKYVQLEHILEYKIQSKQHLTCVQSIAALLGANVGVPRRGACAAGLTPKDIDILVVNCSLFNPTPSLSAMIVNHFKMRSDLISYNLAGMGCSAGVIAIGLAERILRSEPGKYALVVSTENITQARACAR